MDYLPIVGFICFLVLYFSLGLADHGFGGREFKLKNSRQFIMKLETAHYTHQAIIEKDGYISMEYNQKRYKYKLIRTIKNSYVYGGSRRTYAYLVLEKITDDQPPNYESMEKMRLKENKKKKSL